MQRHLPLFMACLGILAVFALFTWYSSESVIRNGVNAIEEEQAKTDMQQLRTYLRVAEERLHQHVLDWAWWDEAWDFMEHRQASFLLHNFDPDYLRELSIASAAFYDLSGTPVARVDEAALTRGSAWAEDEQALHQRIVNFMVRTELESLEGFASVRGEGMVVAAQRVRDGNGLKPARGFLVMSQVLDKNFCEDGEDKMRMRFSVRPSHIFADTHVLVSPGTGIKVSTAKQTIYTYALVYGIFGEPAFCLELRRPRDIAILGADMALKNFFLLTFLGFLLLVSGITFLVSMQRRFMKKEEARRKAKDDLTGLLSMTGFQEALACYLKTARQEALYVAVLCLNLDRFRDVNNSYGHAEGDKLLKEVARRLCTPPLAPYTARSKGDTFWLAGSGTDKNTLMAQSEGLLIALGTPFAVQKNTLHLGASVGLALYPIDGTDVNDLLRRADLALHNAKEQGGGTVACFSAELEEAATRRIRLEAELHKAVEENALTVYYQPKVDTVRQDVDGCEALIRWQSRDGKWVPPPIFIPLAEASGLVTRIDMFVLRSACRQILAWDRDGSGAVPVAVNMSARSILSDGFANEVLRILREEGTPPSLIHLEITETCLMTDVTTASQVITRLHNAGIRIALDDFGTGYSSMQFLYAMPIATIKIDKRFIDGVTTSEGARSLVLGILALATDLGMNTVAEGVEDRHQLAFLTQHRCHIIQGYLFSRPLSGADCGEFLRHRQQRIAEAAGTAAVA